MSTASPLAAPGVLADRLLSRADLASDALLVLSSAAAVGLLAQVSIPVHPVPITGQTLGVMLVGAILGARRGAAALALYAALGVAGLPWFAGFGGGPAYLLQPSFGFILGFIPAAWVVGRLSERRWDRRPLASLGAFGLASAIPFLVGVPWMWAVLRLLLGKTLGLMATLEAGVLPFLPGGVVKWLLASAILTGAWRVIDRPAATR
ncbi:biotin transporter BioY [Schaalia hyovaginalis]|uniref:biotin transporter BioY n=1 Tax=Schaalia hyovaginalis TaxID=29316 RepID=UPI001F463F01|nr:biotin transporter BioY [Schaalia hyovaginalis]MCF2711414.1 biotin transporter BioY [Schaalia hyovaginalis]